jgi:hypothetical protein
MKTTGALYLAIVAVIVVAAYFLWDNIKQAFCDYLNVCPGEQTATQNSAPVTGDEGSTGNDVPDTESLVNRIDSAVFGSSSLGYQEATSTVLSQPWNSFKSIFGIGTN